MNPPIVKRLLICTGALLMTWAVSSSADAGQFYYSAGYGPTPYYAGYGATSYDTGYGPTPYYAAYGPRPYYVGYAPRYYGYRAYRGYPYRSYDRVGYAGYTPWSASYAAYHVSSDCGSGCSSGCNPCGDCGSCGVSYGGCGTSYGGCGTSCDPCGLSSCGGCGIACASGNCGTGDCATGDCGTGISSSPAPQSSPQEPPYSGSSSGPKTYEPDASGGETEGPFTRPKAPSDTGDGGSSDGGSGDGGSEILPGGSGPRGPLDQETNKPADETIHRRKDAAPADAEPTDEAASENPPVPPQPEATPDTESEPNSDDQPAADVQPLRIDSPIAAGITPARTRVRYSVRFHAPRIARVDVSPNTRWTPVDVDARLAVSQ